MDKRLSALPSSVRSNINRYLSTPTADAVRADYVEHSQRRDQDVDLDNYYKRIFREYLGEKELNRETELLYEADLEEVYDDFMDFSENWPRYLSGRGWNMRRELSPETVTLREATQFMKGKRVKGFFLSDMRKFRHESGAARGGRHRRTKSRSTRSRRSRSRSNKGGKKHRKTRRH